MFQKMVLMFLVEDVDKAKSFYKSVFGAKLQFSLPKEPPYEWVSLLLGEIEIMFWQKDSVQKEYKNSLEISEKGSNFITYFYVGDVDSLYNKVKDKVEVMMKPKDQPYGIREFTVKDPFGFVLTFAQVKE